jgi:trans-aconitate methyltransferase
LCNAIVLFTKLVVALQWDVDRYQQQHSFVYQYGTSLVDMVCPMKGERILDIGCGTGELSHELFTTATAGEPDDTTMVVGVDADWNMIQKAREQFASSQVQFVHADVCEMDQDPILSQSPPFDVLFSNAALHWIPKEKMDRAVQNMAHLLKPQTGRFVMEFGGQGNVEAIVTACADVLREQYGVQQIPTPWYFPSIAEFSTILERHGLEVRTAELYDRPTILSDPVNGMKNWIQMFGASYTQAAIAASATADAAVDDEKIIQKKQDLYLEAVQERLRPVLFDGTEWTADYRRIRVTGRRRNESHV